MSVRHDISKRPGRRTGRNRQLERHRWFQERLRQARLRPRPGSGRVRPWLRQPWLPGWVRRSLPTSRRLSPVSSGLGSAVPEAGEGAPHL